MICLLTSTKQFTKLYCIISYAELIIQLFDGNFKAKQVVTCTK